MSLLDLVVEYGPAVFGLCAFFLAWGSKKNLPLENLLAIGISGSTLPAAFFLMYSAFDNSIVDKLYSAPFMKLCIMFAGASLVVIFFRTISQKWLKLLDDDKKDESGK